MIKKKRVSGLNALDKIIETISPQTALKRKLVRKKLDAARKFDEVFNSGYGNYGASRTKKEWKDWHDGGGSATEDIHENLSVLRTRSRDLYMGVPLAAGAMKTYRTNVIGSGLIPKPVLDADALHITEEQADEIEKQISREFYLWADSTSCDSERLSTFYELQQLVFLNWMMSGDVFALLRTKERAGTPYKICVQLIEADRICTPGNITDISPDEKIISGVEIDDDGEVIAYHICRKHPLSTRRFAIGPDDFIRVEAYGKLTGHRNILHIMSRERIGARRGVPIVAPVIESLKQLGRYTNAELVAAVVQGYQTLIIESPLTTTDSPLGEVGEVDDPFRQEQDRGGIKLGPGAIIDLQPGETSKSFVPSRPNANFDSFINSIAKQIGAALEIPHEVLLKQFTSSYSASRAALLEAWKSFSQWREWMVEKFCQPVYEEWLSEAVALGRVSATGFFTDPALKKIWSNAQWYGPTQGQLDPVKEVQAAELRVRYGFSTRAKESMELTGTDFWDNLRTAKRENELMRNAGLYADGITVQIQENEDKNS